jgi:hypothetical protein
LGCWGFWIWIWHLRFKGGVSELGNLVLGFWVVLVVVVGIVDWGACKRRK